MATIQERVQLLVQVISKGMRPLVNNMRTFGGVMTQNLEGFKKQNQANVSMINTGGALANRIRLMTHGMRGFRMEMLGVMFFGMGIQKFFQGLLKPALQLAGVFELMNAILGILFLPTALRILQWAIDFFEFIDKHPGVAKFIRVLTILGIILGTILFLAGMFALGIGSLILAFEKTAVIGVFIGILKGISIAFTTMIPLVALAIIAITGFVSAWRTNFENIREYVKDFTKGIKQMFSGLGNIVKGIFGAIVGFIEGDTEKVMKSLKTFGTGVIDFMKGIVNTVGGLVFTIALSIVKGITNIIDTAFKLIADGITFLMDKISALLRLVGLLPESIGLKMGLPKIYAGGVISPVVVTPSPPPETNITIINQSEDINTQITQSSGAG